MDIVPHKTCTLNCVYCECGATTQLTSEIREYVPTNDIIMEVDRALTDIHELDYITFSGSGEPTLHSELGSIIEYLKINYPLFSIAVLTNGTLLWKKEVRDSLKLADLVIPSLDTVTGLTFEKMLRPHEEITVERIVEGIVEFSREFNGLVYLEIFIIPGTNDSEDEIVRIKKVCENIRHDEIHLNTLDRPAAEDDIEPASQEVLEKIREGLKPLNVRIIGKPLECGFSSGTIEAVTEPILATLRRRPSTIDDLSIALGVNKRELEEILEGLLKQKVLYIERQKRGDFYKIL